MKEISAWWQSSPCKRHLCSSATERAWHWVTAALLMVSCWTGDTTITSRAADRLLFQQGRKISAERLLEQGKREGASLGAKTAEWARGKMTSRRLSCRWIMSPLTLQVTRWSPIQSAPVSQTGQDKRSITICKPTHYLKQRRNSQSIRCKPRFERGTILSQSPAWWIEDDKARDLVWTSGAFWRKDSNLDWSIDQLRWHWRTGTSMSSIEAQSEWSTAEARRSIASLEWGEGGGLWFKISATRWADFDKELMKAAEA